MPVVLVPAALWVKMLTFMKASAKRPRCMTAALAVDVPDLSAAAEERRLAIIDLVSDLPHVDNDGEVEVDGDARLSEGDDNGCYVSAWVWCPFTGTQFDKGDDEDDDED